MSVPELSYYQPIPTQSEQSVARPKITPEDTTTTTHIPKSVPGPSLQQPECKTPKLEFWESKQTLRNSPLKQPKIQIKRAGNTIANHSLDNKKSGVDLNVTSSARCVIGQGDRGTVV